MAEQAEREYAKARAVNESHDDEHGVNLGEPHALAKRPKPQRELAGRLRETDDTGRRTAPRPNRRRS